MLIWRCPTCVMVLRDESVKRCPMCRENLRRHKPIVVGGDRVGDWLRRTPWERHTKAEIDAHFDAKPLPGRR